MDTVQIKNTTNTSDTESFTTVSYHRGYSNSNNTRNNTKKENSSYKKTSNLFGYYAVKYLANNEAHYKIRNPLSLLSEYLESTDATKYSIRFTEDKDDLLVFIDGDIKYLDNVMNQRIVLHEIIINTSDWDNNAIQQLSQFTIKNDSHGIKYSSISHQRSMTEIEVNICYDDKYNEMTLSILAPAWKCNFKTMDLSNTLVDCIQNTIMYGNTPIHYEIIKCFNTFNDDLKKSHPSNITKHYNSKSLPKPIIKNDANNTKDTIIKESSESDYNVITSSDV